MNKFAIVILNWNGVKLLEQFLPAVVNYSADAKIYIADNASTDESIAFVTKNYPNITLLKNSKNLGYAQGYNQALTQVNEPYLCLLNSDIDVTPSWLDAVKERFEKQPETGIIQPKILDFKNKTSFEYAGAAGGFIDRFGFPFCRGRVFETLEKDENQYHSAPIFWASGACMFIRKEIFDQLGGFDPIFFAHQEEIDLCWRAFNAGIAVWYESGSTVYHVGGATLNKANAQKTYLNFRNSLCMMAKNLPSSQLFPIIFARLCMDGVAGIKFMFEGKFKHLWAVFTSHFGFYALLPKMLSKRTGENKTKYYNRNSVVFDYFIKKIDKF